MLLSEIRGKILTLISSRSVFHHFDFEMVEPAPKQILLSITPESQGNRSFKLCILITLLPEGSEATCDIRLALGEGGSLPSMTVGEARVFRQVWDLGTELASLLSFVFNGSL